MLQYSEKYIFDVKFPAVPNATDRICLNIEDRPENRKNPELLKNSYFLIFKLAQTFRKRIAFPRPQKGKNELK